MYNNRKQIFIATFLASIALSYTTSAASFPPACVDSENVREQLESRRKTLAILDETVNLLDRKDFVEDINRAIDSGMKKKVTLLSTTFDLSKSEHGVDSPFSGFGFGAGASLNLSSTPLSLEAVYGFGKGGIHRASLNYSNSSGIGFGFGFLYGNASSKPTLQKTELELKEKVSGPIFNARYSFDMAPVVKPCVEARVGHLKHKISLTVPDSSDDYNKGTHEEDYSGAVYGFGVGFNFDISKNIGLKVGYQCMNYGFKDTLIKGSNTTDEKRVVLKKHKIQHGIEAVVSLKF